MRKQTRIDQLEATLSRVRSEKDSLIDSVARLRATNTDIVSRYDDLGTKYEKARAEVETADRICKERGRLILDLDTEAGKLRDQLRTMKGERDDALALHAGIIKEHKLLHTIHKTAAASWEANRIRDREQNQRLQTRVNELMAENKLMKENEDTELSRFRQQNADLIARVRELEQAVTKPIVEPAKLEVKGITFTEGASVKFSPPKLSEVIKAKAAEIDQVSSKLAPGTAPDKRMAIVCYPDSIPEERWVAHETGRNGRFLASGPTKAAARYRAKKALDGRDWAKGMPGN